MTMYIVEVRDIQGGILSPWRDYERHETLEACQRRVRALNRHAGPYLEMRVKPNPPALPEKGEAK